MIEALSPMSCCPHMVLVIGKGGVGKTTISMYIARELSKRGRTLLMSLDPARHLEKYAEGAEGGSLEILQVSVEEEIEAIASRHAALLRSLMPSLSVLNIEEVADTVRYSPGAEEEIFLRKLLWASRSDYSYVVVDTPPTGVTLRTLALSGLYLRWLSKLIEVRERIVSLRFSIARTLRKEASLEDKALETLYKMREDFEWLRSFLSSPERASYVIVAVPEPLPMYELDQTVKFLRDKLGTGPKLLFLNRILPDEIAERLGVGEAQRKYISQLLSYGARCALVEHIGRPTENFKDIEEVAKRVRLI